MTKKIKATEQSPEWKGYDIDELRYLQAYAQARLEIEKERMLASAQSLYSGTAIKKSGIMGRILGSLTYIQDLQESLLHFPSALKLKVLNTIHFTT